ncbi:hypothetical protein [Lysobacter enzymogenes]|uniref:hypothetical protein n=1 Tax=Lysobacter enzymogenes TaxID=69 RepID=UPI002263B189|nr:hypothetical protein [Lysobacter enzymogenes]UZW59515.1 hypothetical protein BV903_019765 [Lysobacter enzymogenes]
MIRSLTASLLLAGAAASMPAAAGEHVDGSFVFMSADSCYTAGNEGCYLTDPAAAAKAVDELAAVGVKHFLLPGTHPQRDTLAQLRVIARAVKDRGFDFYTYEGWSWKSSARPAARRTAPPTPPRASIQRWRRCARNSARLSPACTTRTNRPRTIRPRSAARPTASRPIRACRA